MKRIGVLLIALAAMSPTLAAGQSQTGAEVTRAILADAEYTNANLRQAPDAYSSRGALEFWSSGGLLQEIPPGGRPESFDAINITPKHIRVIPLVEGQVAVAHFYSEGMIQPAGAPAVSHYLTRVTQVFVKEDGKWKVRSSHWAPVTGGSGTSQTAQEK